MRQIVLCALKDLYLYRYRWRSVSLVCRLLFLLLRYCYSLRIDNINLLFLSIFKMGNPALFIKVKGLTDNVLISLFNTVWKVWEFYYQFLWQCANIVRMWNCFALAFHIFLLLNNFGKIQVLRFECFLPRRKNICCDRSWQIYKTFLLKRNCCMSPGVHIQETTWSDV